MPACRSLGAGRGEGEGGQNEDLLDPLPFFPSAYSAEVASGYVGRAPRGEEILEGLSPE